MKTKSQTLRILSAGVAVILITQAHLFAQTITAENVSTPVITNTIPSDVGPAGTTGAGGYYLFDFKNTSTSIFGDLSNLPGYVTNFTTSGSPYVTNATPPMQVGASTYFTGEDYGTGSAVTPFDYVTFELTGSVPSSFDLGLLNDCSDANVYSLTLYSGMPGATNTRVLSSTPVSDGAYDYNFTNVSPHSANEFYYGAISGATAGDYVVVSGVPTSGNSAEVSLGGVTFDSVTTPEPSTCALILAGLGMLMVMARLRRARS